MKPLTLVPSWILSVIILVNTLVLTKSTTALDEVPLHLATNQGIYTQPISGLYFADSFSSLEFTLDQARWLKSIHGSRTVLNIINMNVVREALSVLDEPVLRAELEKLLPENTEEEIHQAQYRHFHKAVAEACRRGQLYFGAVFWEDLRESLEALTVSLKRENLELSFPAEIQLSNVFFRNNVTECTIRPNDILIKVRVPVKRVGSSFSVRKVNVVPYTLEKDHFCYTAAGVDLHGGFILTRNDQTFLMTSKLEFTCSPSYFEDEEFIRPSGSELCILPPGAKPLDSDSCLNNILSNRSQEVTDKSCRFNLCRKMPGLSNLFRLDSSFFITNPQRDVSISCNYTSKTGTKLTIKPPEVGYIEVKGRCGTCDIDLDGTIYRKKESACPNNNNNEESLEIVNWIPSAVVRESLEHAETERNRRMTSLDMLLESCKANYNLWLELNKKKLHRMLGVFSIESEFYIAQLYFVIGAAFSIYFLIFRAS